MTNRAGAIDQGKDAGIAAARQRVEALLERLTHLDLQVLVVAGPDQVRLAAQDAARAAAVAAGRGPLFDEATSAARETAMQAFARGGFSGTWAATDMAMSVTSARDRIAAASALEEAAMAAVVEDLVDAQTTEVLRSTTAALGSLKGIPPPGSLAAVGMPQRGITGTGRSMAVAVLALLLGFTGIVALQVTGLSLGVALIVGLARQRTPLGG